MSLRGFRNILFSPSCRNVLRPDAACLWHNEPIWLREFDLDHLLKPIFVHQAGSDKVLQQVAHV